MGSSSSDGPFARPVQTELTNSRPKPAAKREDDAAKEARRPLRGLLEHQREQAGGDGAHEGQNRHPHAPCALCFSLMPQMVGRARATAVIAG